MTEKELDDEGETKLCDIISTYRMRRNRRAIGGGGPATHLNLPRTPLWPADAAEPERPSVGAGLLLTQHSMHSIALH